MAAPQPWQGSTLVDQWICTFTPERREDAPLCGRPAEYEISFGWEDGTTSLACAEHTALARQRYHVEWVRSV
jgi:hypothetical protein